MSFGELLLTLVVALTVFGPKKLPMVAHHLGQWASRFNRFKQQAAAFWQQQQNEQQLQDNIRKAQKADAGYQQEKKL